jgi:peptide/nickel transport system permease protein
MTCEKNPLSAAFFARTRTGEGWQAHNTWLPATSIIDELSTFSEVLWALVLPSATLAIVMGAYATRMLRDNLIEILDADFIKFVSLNGISRRRIV